MNGSECKFVKYMEGSDKRFVIPVYQRNYDWKTENCKQLYDDLVKIVKGHRRSHFFGSIVSVFNSKGHNDEYLIIDGQQRLTTVSLLFLAMYNLIEQGVMEAESPILKQRIFEDYLVDKWKPEETRIKLKPVKNDQMAFGKLFADPDEYVHDSNLTVNYNYFYERIQKQEITLDQLYDAICCLEIIYIKLDGDDDAQLIFESLNSTGLDLSAGDKIRNFILMGLPSGLQEEYYEKYWNRIEKCTKYNVSAFVRDFLSVKQQSIPAQKKIYSIFKEYVELGNLSTESLLSEMLAYAKRYQILLEGATGNRELDACVYRLNRLETTVARPFLLEVLRLYDEGTLTIADVVQVFNITENYVFRRFICGLTPSALNKIFLMLHRDVVRLDQSEENYLEKFKYLIRTKKEGARFPGDEEFARAFSERQVYLINSKNKVYIFERLENYGTKEDKDIYRHCDDGDYSIEHIMPQHLTPAWQKALGDDYEEIHEVWLHRIANLTLTAYNSKYSNNSFSEKKSMKNGFEDSGIRMNTWIAKKEKWTLEELEERDRYLVDRAMTIWALPTSTYQAVQKQMEAYTLEDEEVFTGRKVAKFAFKKTEQPVKSWVELFQKVIQILYEEDKSIITKLAYSNDESLSSFFAVDKDMLLKSVEIGDGIFLFTNNSTQSKVSVLSRLFALYQEDSNNLLIYLRDENDLQEEEPGSIHECYRNYWAYALPIIHKAQGENGTFRNVTTSRYNWISGATGISGFWLCCAANRNNAKMQFIFGKKNKEKNKEAYDKLYAHRKEIESVLGDSLRWKRNDDGVSSIVDVQIDGVNVQNEVDWLQMANFHANWSKRFYDVILPYVMDEWEG